MKSFTFFKIRPHLYIYRSLSFFGFYGICRISIYY